MVGGHSRNLTSAAIAGSAIRVADISGVRRFDTPRDAMVPASAMTRSASPARGTITRQSSQCGVWRGATGSDAIAWRTRAENAVQKSGDGSGTSAQHDGAGCEHGALVEPVRISRAPWFRALDAP